jgi:hypothetical protein
LSKRPVHMVFDFNSYNAVHSVVEDLSTEEVADIWAALTEHQENLSPIGMHLRKQCAQRLNEDTGETNDISESSDAGEPEEPEDAGADESAASGFRPWDS